MKLTRRNFVRLAGIAGLVGLTNAWTGCSDKTAGTKNIAEADKLPLEQKAKVYFTKNINAEHLIKIYQQINSNIVGKVGIKLHTGEPHGPNIIPAEMVKPFQAQISNSTIIETNTLYAGARSTTKRHRKVLEPTVGLFAPLTFSTRRAI